MKKILFILFVALIACEKDNSGYDAVRVSGKPTTVITTHTHPWADIILTETDKTYLNKQPYSPIYGRTTAEINATVPVDGDFGITYDKELRVYKVWTGSMWRNIILQ